MRTLWIPILAIAALTPMCGAAADTYQQGMNLYGTVWSHLDQAQKHIAPYPGDWYRWDLARGQMDLLERGWKAGSCDRAQVSTAITDLQLIVDNNNLSSADRKILRSDVEKLRDNQLKYCR